MLEGTYLKFYYNKNYIYINAKRQEVSMSSTENTNFFSLPNNCKANVTYYTTCIILNEWWYLNSTPIIGYVTFSEGSNVVKIRTNSTFNNGIILFDAFFPIGFFTIS